ncbi:hypothetical protein Tco_1240600 [Tanacetum coccineum]
MGENSGEVVYSTSLRMVKVKYSANVRRIVDDFLHVPPNGYSPRPNDKQQCKDTEDTDVGLREADSETESMKKAFQDMQHELGES